MNASESDSISALAATGYVLRSAAHTLLESLSPGKLTHACSCLSADKDGSWGVTALSCYSHLPNFSPPGKHHTHPQGTENISNDSAKQGIPAGSTTQQAGNPIEGSMMGLDGNEQLDTVDAEGAILSQHEQLDSIDGE